MSATTNKKPYPGNWSKATILKRLKPFVVVDPFSSGGHGLVQSFDTEQDAKGWLTARLAEDKSGYDGCAVATRDHAVANHT